MTPRVRSLSFVALALGAAAFFVACGLDVAGTASIDATDGDASPAIDGGVPPIDGSAADGDQPSDAGTAPDADAALPPPPIDASGCDAAAGCVVVPTGWTVVAFEPTRSASCPTGFADAGPLDVVEGPTAPPSACACEGCAVTTQPSCASGAVQVFFDTGGPMTCALPGVPAQNANNPAGSCGTDMYTGAVGTFDVKYVPPPPSGGACAAQGLVEKQNVTYAASERLCNADSLVAAGCKGSDCTPTLPAPFKACIAGAGNQSCPAPYTDAHHIGTDVTYTCSACSCAVTATCTGTMTLYTDTGCTMGAHSLAADGVCRGSGKNGPFNSYRYTGNSPSNVTCQAGLVPPPTGLTLTNQLTVCCAP